MADDYMTLTIPCRKCGGTGIHRYYISVGESQELVEEPCDICGGDGRLEDGRLTDNIPAATRTFRVLECVAPAEYAALSAGNKSILSMILSCGIVDLSEGTFVRTLLADMFGAGTTTRANLLALIS
jgi:hypothetical protein